MKNDLRSRSSRDAKTSRDLASLVVALLLTCSKPVPAPSAPYTGPIVVLPDGYNVRVEIAADDPTREQGLMFRDRVPAGTGMLFLFPRRAPLAFWMKNTLVPLDMIFIDDRRVVHVQHDVPPCKADPCPSYPSPSAANYVLELGAGEAARHRVENGATLKFERLENVVVR